MRHLILASLAALAGCVTTNDPVEDYAFVGAWDCGVEIFTITNTTYNNGTNTFPIGSVSRDGDNYTLYIQGFLIGLGAVTDTGLTWVSGTTGDQFNCLRVRWSGSSPCLDARCQTSNAVGLNSESAGT
jgi:hypothetical protein